MNSYFYNQFGKLLVFLITASILGTSHAGYTPDFLNKEPFTGWVAHLCCDYSAQQVNDPVDNTNRVIQFLLERKEAFRAELSSDRIPTEYEHDYWYAFSIYIPISWEADTTHEVVAQWHSRPDVDLGDDPHSPPLYLRVIGDNWEIVSRWDSNLITNQDEDTETLWSAPLDKGRWVNWVFHVKWSYNDIGLLEIWKDEELIVNRIHANTFNDLAGAPYFKFGLYKWSWRPVYEPSQSIVSKRVAYFDNIHTADGEIKHDDFIKIISGAPLPPKILP